MRTRTFQIVVVALLAIIALETGGWPLIKEGWADAGRYVRNLGKAEELPAPSPRGQQGDGIAGLYSDDIEAGIQRKIQAERESRTAPALPGGSTPKR